MKYTLLAVITDEKYKDRIETYLSNVDCIENILFLNLSDTASAAVDGESSQNTTLISRIKSVAQNLQGKELMVLPQTLLPSVKFFEYASKALDETTGALILGLHDNKCVSEAELVSLKEP